LNIAENPTATPVPAALGAVAPAVVAIPGRDGVVELPSPLLLHHGGQLTVPRIAWHLAGPAGAPVVAVLGGISAERVVAAEEGGWWDAGIGHGRGVDTLHWQVLGIDYLGGSGASSGPSRTDAAFPTLSTFDQAAALLAVMDALGIEQLHAIVGASYGGMVALAFAERYPERVSRLVVMSAAEKAHPLSTAWRSVQR
jgi:homoserine O-acetyltransferase